MNFHEVRFPAALSVGSSGGPERRTEIARKGGQKVHALGLGHRWTKEEASKAGQVGGQISRGGRGRVTPKP